MVRLFGQPLKVDPSAAPVETLRPLAEDPDLRNAVRRCVYLDSAHHELADSAAPKTRAHESRQSHRERSRREAMS
jgi:hypothetical protein